MTEKEKLIELIEAMPEEIDVEEFADYLLKNGIIVPPILVGTEIYTREILTDRSVAPMWVTALTSGENGVQSFWCSGGELPISAEFLVEDIGKTVFLTREEAEQSEKEREENA